MPGDDVEIVLRYENVGTVPMTGTVAIEIRSSTGVTSVNQLDGAFSGLAPGATDAVTTTWTTSADGLGVFTILDTARYDSKATVADPVEVEVGKRLFLPTILRGSR
jgi:hypothetical protein